MDILHIILVLVIVGIVLYLVQTYIPMSPPIKTVLMAVVVILLCLWLLSLFGIGSIRVGR